MSSPSDWFRSVTRFGADGYAALQAIRHAGRNRRLEKPDDERRALLYGRWIKSGDVVFDIGANVGNRTRVFAGLGAHVVALEPQAHCQAVLRWQFLFERRVTVVRAAAGRDNTPQRLVQFETDVLSSMNPAWVEAARHSGQFGELRPTREVVVPCVTLDQLIARHGRPVFTKIDVEGYEAEVLAGLSQPGGTISFEVTPGMPQVARACLQKLAALGYTRFQFSAGESMQLTSAWSDLDTMYQRLDRLVDTPADFGDIYALAPGQAG